MYGSLALRSPQQFAQDFLALAFRALAFRAVGFLAMAFRALAFRAVVFGLDFDFRDDGGLRPPARAAFP